MPESSPDNALKRPAGQPAPLRPGGPPPPHACPCVSGNLTSLRAGAVFAQGRANSARANSQEVVDDLTVKM